MTDDTTCLTIRGNENYGFRLYRLRRFLLQADALGCNDMAWLYANQGAVRLTLTDCDPPECGDMDDVGFDVETWSAEIECRVEALESSRPTAPDGQPAATDQGAEQDESVALLHADLDKALAERDHARQENERLTTELKTERDEARKTARDNGHQINALQAELAAGKQNASEPRKIILGEAEQVQAIERLLLAIAAHRASSHGGRMVDAGDQILHNTADEVARQFDPKSRPDSKGASAAAS